MKKPIAAITNTSKHIFIKRGIIFTIDHYYKMLLHKTYSSILAVIVHWELTG